MSASSKSVALVNMPFAPIDRPSVQIGILASLLQEAGIASEELHANLDFFELLRQHDYHRQYNAALPALVGEWYFSEEPLPEPELDSAAAVSDDTEPDHRSPVEQLQRFAATWGSSYRHMLTIRLRLVPLFLERLLERTAWERVGVAAFTVTYPQVCASFALARALKKKQPSLFTLFGGAASQLNDSSVAEYMRVYPFIDAMVVGEAEPVFAQICAAALAGETIEAQPGVWLRDQDGRGHGGGMSLLAEIDAAPLPDLRGFARKKETMRSETRVLIRDDVPIEMARGCPVVDAKRCSFCGFYPHRAYRRKSTTRILDEVRRQSAQLGWTTFAVLDSAVTKPIIADVFGSIAAENPEIDFSFVEVRTDLQKKHVATLAAARVRLIQPGIECLDDDLLTRISKGVSLFQNLLFLKWCRELGIDVSYNLLVGIPDAEESELRRQLEVVARIPHLAPPYLAELGIVRFSVYADEPERYCLGTLTPDPFYRLLFAPELNPSRVAFAQRRGNSNAGHRFTEIYEQMTRDVSRWQDAWQDQEEPPYLTLRRDGGLLVIADGRVPGRSPEQIRCTELQGSVYATIMDRAFTREEIAGRCGGSESEIATILDELIARDLVLERRERYLALAVAAD